MVLFALCAVGAAGSISRFHALERPGVHHVAVRGRLVDAKGAPVVGAESSFALRPIRFTTPWCAIIGAGTGG
jgi:hypothetical protein